MYLQDQYTPLYVASAESFTDVVKTLIAANADVNCVCKVRKLLAVCGNKLLYGSTPTDFQVCCPVLRYTCT